MPLALAVLAPNEALEVMAAYPSVESWAVGGHSLGGAMAARLTYTHPEAVDGLVLWAAYPASTDDLSSSDVIVTSIYGTLDGLSTGDKIDASRPLLPGDTQWVPIEGGNHAQFGDYGVQSGDGSATIPPPSSRPWRPRRRCACWRPWWRLHGEALAAYPAGRAWDPGGGGPDRAARDPDPSRRRHLSTL